MNQSVIIFKHKSRNLFYFFPVLILLFLLISRRRKDKNLLEVDAADDIRENVVFYDEEGAGQLLWQPISNHNVVVSSNAF